MKHFILMADVIGSSNMPSQALITEFKKLVKACNSVFAASLESPLTITLGDEFQCVVKDLNSAVKILFYLEEYCIHNRFNFKLRYVLHEGEIDTPINHMIAYEMMGPGLSTARKSLTELKSSKSRFIISIHNLVQNDLLSNAFVVLNAITQQWNYTRDWSIVSNLLLTNDYKKTASNLGKNRSLIWKRERSLQLESYYSIKKIIQISASLYPP